MLLSHTVTQGLLSLDFVPLLQSRAQAFNQCVNLLCISIDFCTTTKHQAIKSRLNGWTVMTIDAPSDGNADVAFRIPGTYNVA